MKTYRTWTWTGLVVAALLLLTLFTTPDARAEGFVEDSSFGLLLGNFDPINSADSYNAVYGSSDMFYGLRWDYHLREFLTIQGEYHHFAASGERVNQLDDGWVSNGIPEDLTYDGLLATAIYQFRRDYGTRPFVGAGLGFYMIDVSSTVGGQSFNKPGYHFSAGALFLAEKRISFTGEIRWSMIPGVLGDNPNSVSAYYGDSDAGGLAFAASVLYNFGH